MEFEVGFVEKTAPAADQQVGRPYGLEQAARPA